MYEVIPQRLLVESCCSYHANGIPPGNGTLMHSYFIRGLQTEFDRRIHFINAKRVETVPINLRVGDDNTNLTICSVLQTTLNHPRWVKSWHAKARCCQTITALPGLLFRSISKNEVIYAKLGKRRGLASCDQARHEVEWASRYQMG